MDNNRIDLPQSVTGSFGSKPPGSGKKPKRKKTQVGKKPNRKTPRGKKNNMK